MSKVEYKPKSHFFVDHTGLIDPLPANLVTDAFGPVSGSETTKYRTTSMLKTASTSKVFAICDGHLFIQPQTGDATKVNLILRPSASYAPFKIKYFIYRGVNKSDLIDGTNLKVIDAAISPAFLQRIWADYITFNTADGSTAPTTFPSNLIGYDPTNQLDNSLISTYFFNSSNDPSSSFEIPKCNKGEHLGNFTGEIGLDVVLDYGDYELDYEEQLFKLDLEYARKKQHVFDISTITGMVKQKRYREYIHQFIDAAAFWGSHIECGEIRLFNDALPKTTINDIFGNIVSKYQTKNKLYIYITGERGRSYNFYGNYPSGNLSFETYPTTTPSLVQYKTHDWPIIIKSFNQSGATIRNVAQITIEYNFDINIIGRDINIYAHSIIPRLKRVNFIHPNELIDSSNATGTTQCKPIRIPLHNIDKNGQKFSVSSFVSINFKGKQAHSDVAYYNDLWSFNIKNLISVNNSKDVWTVKHNGLLPNMLDILGVRCIKTQQKVFEDLGQDVGGNIKKRKLYIVGFEDSHSREGKEYLKIGGFTSGLNNITKVNLGKEIYGNNNFNVYKGSFNDNTDIINSLALTNNEDYQLKQAYFQLGITEEEYNKLLYDNPIVPNPLPSSLNIPKDATNIYFYLDEDSSIASNKSYRKFNLGIRFENNVGIIETKFPSASNEVKIYTIDGFFFFSKEYSDYQQYYLEKSQVVVHFRPLSNWEGEYGFDWIRIGDSGHTGDTISPTDRRLIENIGHYYDASNPSFKEGGDGNIFRNIALFKKEKTEFNAFQTQFEFYPNFTNSAFYSVPYLYLYPSRDRIGNNTVFPKLNLSGNQKCLVEATLKLIINTSTITVNSLKIKFEKQNFEITSNSGITALPDTVISGITYGWLQINNSSGTSYPSSIDINVKALNEFDVIKKIQVIATENGVEALAGELFIAPNSKANRKELEIVLADCKTNLTPVSGGSGYTDSYGLDTWHPTSPTNQFKNKVLDELNKTLNQSLIDIKNVIIENLDITRSVEPVLYSDFGSSPQFTLGSYSFNHFNPDRIVNPTTQEKEYINNRLISLVTTNFRGKLLIVCINEYCGSPSGTNFEFKHGEADIDRGVFLPTIVMYKSGLYRSPHAVINEFNVLGHEGTHALGLYHTFSNSNYYTHKVYVSDNVMDYKNATLNPLKIRISTNKYQWEVMRKNRIITNEI
ncbi:MAG: hypothetical protein KGY51_00120 [Psychroflexus sp.]|nr:hypothetical protein [Psychroflexus sp.]